MALLTEKDSKFLKDYLAEHLVNPVRLLFFTQTMACQFCKETEAIMREVTALSDKISLKVYNLVTDKDVAVQYGIDKIPATVVMSDIDKGVRFYGIPSGYEFTSLVEAIVMVSRGKTNLSAETLKALAEVKEPVHIQVLVTPTCPYCPAAVQLAHAMAVACDQIHSDMIEAIEFPQLAHKYDVQGVPRIVINETVTIEGAASEPLFLARVQQAVGLKPKEEVDQLFADAGAKTTPAS